MSKEQVLATLRKNRSTLESAGVEHVALFGSFARAEEEAGSDVDVVVELSERVRQSGFGYFGALERLQAAIEHMTGRRVDIVAEPVQNARLRREIERDRTIAF